MKGDQGHPIDIYCYILYTSVETADQAHVGTQDLLNHGPTPSWDDRLVG
jgi:hypothetical protein